MDVKGRVEGCGTDEHREGRRGTEPGSVPAGGDQQSPGDTDANAMELQDIGIDRGDQLAQIGIEAVDFLAQVAVAAGQEMQRLLEGGLELGSLGSARMRVERFRATYRECFGVGTPGIHPELKSAKEIEERIMADDMTTLVRLGDSDLTVANEAEDVRGRKVIDRSGEETGTLDGLLIDEAERKVRFLEVSSGGFLGLGKKQVLVPVDAVTRVDDENVYIDKDREHVASSPGYDPELMPEPDRPYIEDVYGYYGYPPHWGAGYMYPGYPYR